MRHNRTMREKIESVLIEGLIDRSEYELVFTDDKTCVLMFSAGLTMNIINMLILDLEDAGFQVKNNNDYSFDVVEYTKE